MDVPKTKKMLPMKEKSLVPALDYIKLIEDLQDEAVAFCVEKLYPLCGYKVLRPKDVRRVDLEEWLLGLYESQGGSLLSAKGIVELYLQTLEKYVAHYVTYPSDEKKVGLYKERLSTAINVALSKSGTLENIDDAVLIFLNLLRPLQISEVDSVPAMPNELLSLRFADTDLLESVWKGSLKQYNPKSKFAGLKIPIGVSDKDGKLAYINNILFLARGLQQFGAFDKE